MRCPRQRVGSSSPLSRRFPTVLTTIKWLFGKRWKEGERGTEGEQYTQNQTMSWIITRKRRSQPRRERAERDKGRWKESESGDPLWSGADGGKKRKKIRRKIFNKRNATVSLAPCIFFHFFLSLRLCDGIARAESCRKSYGNSNQEIWI